MDVRAEPKFYIPTGEVYTGAWCRPQHDGPALRAFSLLMFAENLQKNGKDFSKLWNINGGLIKTDLDFLLHHWAESTCDLWEEIQSPDLFWNLMAYRHTLDKASQFASDNGEKDLAGQCDNVRAEIEKKIDAHWTGSYIFNDQKRLVDGSVLHAIVSFDGYIQLNDEKVLDTIIYYNNVFCNLYQINQDDTRNNIPGVLWGRYVGDVYAGGNPWQLLSSSIAEYYYKSAGQIMEGKYNNQHLTESAKSKWRKLTHLTSDFSLLELAAAQLQAGDAILQRIFQHVKNDGYRIDEQIDRWNGKQANARSLTWSYANLLRTLHLRNQVAV